MIFDVVNEEKSPQAENLQKQKISRLLKCETFEEFEQVAREEGEWKSEYYQSINN